MQLNRLWKDEIKGMTPQEATPEINITALTADSRQVRPGMLFAALPGSQSDGRDFIPQALAAGARAILLPNDSDTSNWPERPHGPVAFLADPNPRQSLARMAARFYQPQPSCCLAVTGTNGKTSVAAFVRQLWQGLGKQAASLGTLGLVPPHPLAPPALTTPDPVALHRCLRELTKEGTDHLVLEASSHGLDQYRLDGLSFQVACFTNLSRDHLDYHKTFEAYLAAKARLFKDLLVDDGTAVINADDPASQTIVAIARERGVKVLDFGKSATGLKLLSQIPDGDGQALTIGYQGNDYDLHLPLAGAFQGWNLLAAIAMHLALGQPLEPLLQLAGQLQGVPGRIEKVAKTSKGGLVYVDYAHTPDALTTLLQALRPHTQRRLWAIFGCGGDRDPGKRPLMGAAVRAAADKAIVTDDNPRSEDPASIRRAALEAVPEALDIGDRRLAIRTALQSLDKGDVLVIAGKGHESGQTVGDQVLAFDDRDVAREEARALGGEVFGGNGQEGGSS